MDFDEQKEIYSDKIDLKKALTGTLPDDNSLLEELGINLSIIKKESLLIFKVFKPSDIKVSFIEDADMSGPIIFILLYTLCMFINCKMHFGYVYLISLISLLSIYFLLNVIDTVSIGLLQCCSVMGYAFVPMIIFAFLNIFLNWSGSLFRIIMGILFSLWSSYVSTTVFILYLGLANRSLVVWYPLMLCYGCFSLLVIF
ncbi:Protein transport protein yip1 [Nosema granulosis]|uniref:Protein YIP n=1 Tax=Nosema granulosis TaxID=83296 RepID=A0A9P6KYI8_9MICR|nr:Protein transport protein yip1 [Nosema granulosis]